jgi:hypothetical protein
MEGVILPGRLQSLEFGWHFKQSLTGVPLPHTLESLTFQQLVKYDEAHDWLIEEYEPMRLELS